MNIITKHSFFLEHQEVQCHLIHNSPYIGPTERCTIINTLLKFGNYI